MADCPSVRSKDPCRVPLWMSSQIESRGVCLLCHLCNDKGLTLPLKEGRKKWQPLPPCKVTLELWEHLVVVNFEEQTVGTKPLLFVLTNCVFWWSQWDDYNPWTPSDPGTENLPDLLGATFWKVWMIYEGSHAISSWVTRLRVAEPYLIGDWRRPYVKDSHTPSTPYFPWLQLHPFPSNRSFSERVCLNKIII